MPIYEYEASEPAASCPHCRDGFELRQSLKDPALVACPACGHPVRKRFSAPSIGASRSGLDDRARRAGFHKLQRLGKGEYEKKY